VRSDSAANSWARPGARLAVSEVVVRGTVPEEVRKSTFLWVGCTAGALEERDDCAKLTKAGFSDTSIGATRIYDLENTRQFLTDAEVGVDAIAPRANEKFMSAFRRASELKTACCEPACCRPVTIGTKE
jgi:hypothetical protein